MKSLLDAFFGSAPAPDKKYRSEAAKKFFKESPVAGSVREKRAREALDSFNKLPERVRVAVFERAKLEPRKVYELTPAQRVRLMDAAEKMRDEIAAKLVYANTAVQSLMVLVDFKDDRGQA